MFEAVLFDFDGVIVDSERYWSKNEHQAFSQMIPGWKDGDQKELMGLSYLDFPKFLSQKYGIELPFEAYERAADAIAKTVYAQCELVPGVLELLEKIDAAGIIAAVASSSKHDWINGGLDKFGIRPRFAHIVSSQDMGPGRGKPMPDIYVEAAKRCGADIRNCLVIEDSGHGVAAGVSSGAHCIALRAEHNTHQDLSRAHRIVDSLFQIDV